LLRRVTNLFKKQDTINKFKEIVKVPLKLESAFQYDSMDSKLHVSMMIRGKYVFVNTDFVIKISTLKNKSSLFQQTSVVFSG